MFIIFEIKSKMKKDKNKLMILLHRFDEARWIKSLINGKVSFSCVENFLKSYEKDGNFVRGDAFEGVFAHLPKTDDRVQKAICELGSDLEIINDGDYVYLRRHSVKKIPIFCIYMIDGETLVKNINRAGIHDVEIFFDSRLVEGFSKCESKNDDEHINILSIYPQQFITPITDHCFGKGIIPKYDKVKYQDIHGDYYLKPTDKYEELFIKDTTYSYQHEERMILPRERVYGENNRYDIELQPFEYINISPVNMRLTFNIEVSEIEE